MNPLDELAMKMLRQYFKRPEVLLPLSPDLAEIPELHRECLAVQGFFHMVGISPDDISLGVSSRDPEDGEGLDLIVVARMEPRPMVIRVAPLPADVDTDALQAGWQKTVAIWNAAALPDKARLVSQSNVFEDFPDFFLGGSEQGVVFPTTLDLLARLHAAYYEGPEN